MFNNLVYKLTHAVQVNNTQLNVLTIVVPKDSIFMDFYKLLSQALTLVPVVSVVSTSIAIMYACLKEIQNNRLVYKFDELKNEFEAYKSPYHQEYDDFSEEESDNEEPKPWEVSDNETVDLDSDNDD
jgi:hypothetical protein